MVTNPGLIASRLVFLVLGSTGRYSGGVAHCFWYRIEGLIILFLLQICIFTSPIIIRGNINHDVLSLRLTELFGWVLRCPARPMYTGSRLHDLRSRTFTYLNSRDYC